jgi:hypothetical protein
MTTFWKDSGKCMDFILSSDKDIGSNLTFLETIFTEDPSQLKNQDLEVKSNVFLVVARILNFYGWDLEIKKDGFNDEQKMVLTRIKTDEIVFIEKDMKGYQKKIDKPFPWDDGKQKFLKENIMGPLFPLNMEEQNNYNNQELYESKATEYRYNFVIIKKILKFLNDTGMSNIAEIFFLAMCRSTNKNVSWEDFRSWIEEIKFIPPTSYNKIKNKMMKNKQLTFIK